MNVYEKVYFINIKGEWEECGSILQGEYVVSAEAPTKVERWYDNFGSLWNNCHNIKKARRGVTCFRKIPYVALSSLERDCSKFVTAKNMKKPIGYRIDYQLIKNPSYQFLVNNLTAPDFIKYTKYFEEKYAKPLDNSAEI